jgi:hypothetical protein
MSKMIMIGSSPKGCNEDNLVQSEVTRTTLLPAERQILTHSLSLIRNMVSLYLSGLRTGKPTARKAERGAGIGVWKKRTPFRNGMDRGFKVTSRESGQTSAWWLFTRNL